MKTFTIQSLVINRDTIHEAQTRSEDIWDTAANGPSIIFLAPEQLINPEFSNLIKEDGEFAGRVCAIAVDEAHLLNTWGKRWRKCFQQIGWVRARFSRVTMIAMTATMRRGKHMDSVCEFLGFHEGKFHLIRRSNARPDIQILFRKMKGIGGKKFPELDWVMEGKRKTFILCRTIHLGNRVNDYLRSLGGGNPNLNKRIRMYNAVNWPDFNAETRRWMEEEDTCQIIIGTDTLSVGVNITCAEDVIILGQVEDIDELVQKLGRVGRDKERVTNPRGIIYLPKDVEASARRIVEFENGDLGKLKKGDTMELSMAQMIIADCKPVEQNRQYDNPVEDRPCSCSTCRSRARSNPAPSCSCSGCRPEDQFEDQAPSKSSKRKNPEIPRLKRLSGPMRRLGTEKLTDYRMEIWEGADEVQAGLLPPIIFLPDSDIKLILDNFALLTSTNAISTHLKHNKYICDRLQHTLDVVQLLDRGFEPIRKENKDKAKAAREKAKAKKLAQQEGEKGVQGGDIRSVESEEGSGSEETGGGSDIEEDRDKQEDAMIDQPPKFQRTGFTMSEAYVVSSLANRMNHLPFHS